MVASAFRPGNSLGSRRQRPDSRSPICRRSIGTWMGRQQSAPAAAPTWLSGPRVRGPAALRTRVVFLPGGITERAIRFPSSGRGTVLQLGDSQQSCFPTPSPCSLDPVTPLILFLGVRTYLQLPKLAVPPVLPSPASKLFTSCFPCERASDTRADQVSHFLFVSPLVRKLRVEPFLLPHR